MTSIIICSHEEHYSDGRTIGILTNLRPDTDLERIDSFPYIFRNMTNNHTQGLNSTDGMYIFFETIVDMNDYMLYGDDKVKRAYMKEIDFDKLYDNKMDIMGEFNDYLKWQ